jgi:hypothetical protein
MCLIVWKEGKDAFFTNRQFKNMIHRNSDGLGFMWRENNRVCVDKILGTPKDKFRMFKKYRHKPYFAMHARMKTHGLIDLNNCHPYEIMNKDKGDPIDLYLMHNGVLSDAPNVDNKMSDTWHFVEYILKPIAKANLDVLWSSEQFQIWLTKKIGGSKLILMRSDTVEGQAPVLIFNESLGSVENGCWLSNTHSTKDPYVSTMNYGRGNASTNDPFRRNLPVVTQNSQIPTQSIAKTNQDTTKDTTETTDGTNSNILNFCRSKGLETEYSIMPDEHLYNQVLLLQGQPLYQITFFVREDPDRAADIIMAFYDKNTMDYDTIMEQIKDPNTIGGIVDIVQHISQTIESIVKTRNVN